MKMGYLEHQKAKEVYDAARESLVSASTAWREHTARSIKEAKHASAKAIMTAAASSVAVSEAMIEVGDLTADIASQLVITTAETALKAAENNKIIADALIRESQCVRTAIVAEQLVHTTIPDPGSFPPAVTVMPPNGVEPTACIIMLHGLTGSSDNFNHIPEYFGFKNVKYIFPNAKTMKITHYEGTAWYEKPAWYDVNFFEYTTGNEFESGIAFDRENTMESVAYINSIIDGVIADGIPASKIILGSWSQGGCIGLHVALQSKVKLAGYIGFAPYLTLLKDYPDVLGPYAREIPFYVEHGFDDSIITMRYAEFMQEFIQKMGVDITLNTYEGIRHLNIIGDEKVLTDVKNHISKTLSIETA